MLSVSETVLSTNQSQEIREMFRRLTQSHEGTQQQPSSLCALQGQSTILSCCPQEVFSYTNHQLQVKSVHNVFNPYRGIREAGTEGQNLNDRDQ